MQTETPFLDQWLLNQTSPPPPSPPSQPPPARDILRAWADIRAVHHRHRLLESLSILVNAESTLHVADPHAKLLLPLLSSPDESLKPLLHRLLHVWARKSARPSALLLESALRTLVSSPSADTEGVFVLVGSIAAAPSLPENSRSDAVDFLCRILESGTVGIGSELVLAGIGYALSRSSSDDSCFGRLFRLLLGGVSVSVRVKHAVMVLGLVEWLVVELINSRGLDKIDSICRELLVAGYSRVAVVMSVAGVLRAFRRAPQRSRVELNPNMKRKLEGCVIDSANYVVSKVKDGTYELDDDDRESHLLMQCIALGLARCGPFTPDGAVLRCVCFALLNDVFPLSFFKGLDSSSTTSVSVSKVREHLSTVLFREAGAMTSVLCNQYALTDENSRVDVERCIWGYCQEFYSKLRTTFLIFETKKEELLNELEKMEESIFLMVVVFAAVVSKQKLDAKSSYPRVNKSEVAANILVSFSCIEYLRRIRWPEYTDVVRRAVLTLQENSSASALFVDSMPFYDDLTNVKGLPGLKYCWNKDDVQTARMLFYLRVIPTCVGRISNSMFRKKVASIMFLYMCHPNVKVSQASHSVFVAFISSENDETIEDEHMVLKEQLSFYYVQRTLEFYPSLTPYKSMAAGISALVRYLPAGSPAIFFCINSLVEKTLSLFSLAIKDDPDLWKKWQGESEPFKEVLELLLHLVTTVDIQVLPNLLKLLAQFIIQLPKEGQTVVLDEIYSTVSESDDVTRKPTFVSWLHSLSYLSSQAKSPARDGENVMKAASSLNLSQSTSRL